MKRSRPSTVVVTGAPPIAVSTTLVHVVDREAVARERLAVGNDVDVEAAGRRSKSTRACPGTVATTRSSASAGALDRGEVATVAP